MLGFLLVVVQVLLFLCAAGLLLLLRKSFWQTNTAGGGYASSYQDDEPDYRNYEYEDEADGGYNEYYAQPDNEAQNTMHQIKSQQYEYAGETEHYNAEMKREQHFAGQSAAYAYQDASATAPQSFSQDQMVPPASADMDYRQNSHQTATRSQTEAPQPSPHAGLASSHAQSSPEMARYYNEDTQVKDGRSQQPHNEESPSKSKSQPDAKGVLFDDNDDDMAPFKVKF